MMGQFVNQRDVWNYHVLSHFGYEYKRFRKSLFVFCGRDYLPLLVSCKPLYRLVTENEQFKLLRFIVMILKWQKLCTSLPSLAYLSSDMAQLIVKGCQAHLLSFGSRLNQAHMNWLIHYAHDDYILRLLKISTVLNLKFDLDVVQQQTTDVRSSGMINELISDSNKINDLLAISPCNNYSELLTLLDKCWYIQQVEISGNSVCSRSYNLFTKLVAAKVINSENWKSWKSLIRLAIQQNVTLTADILLTIVPEDVYIDDDILFEIIRRRTISVQLFPRMNPHSRRLAMEVLESAGGLLQVMNEEIRDDHMCVLTAVRSNGVAIQWASERLRHSNYIILEAMRSNPNIMINVSRTSPLLRNKEVVKYAASARAADLSWIDDSLLQDKSFMRDLVDIGGQNLKYAHPEIRSDREIVLAAVSKRGSALEFASDELKASKEVVIAAVNSEGGAYSFADPTLQQDKDVILRALKSSMNTNTLNIPEHLVNDPDVIKGLYSLLDEKQEIPVELLHDKDFVLSVMSDCNGKFYAALPYDMQTDRDVILLAAKKYNPFALSYITLTQSIDREIASAFVRNNANSLRYLPEKYRSDKEIVLLAVERSPTIIEVVSSDLLLDRDVILSAVRLKGEHIKRIRYTEMESDRELIAEAQKTFADALYYASSELRSDREFVKVLIDIDANAYRHISPMLQMDRDLLLHAVRKSPMMLEHADLSFKSDKILVQEAVMQNGCALMFASAELRDDLETVLLALSSSSGVIRFVSQRLMQNESVIRTALQKDVNVLQIISGGEIFDNKEVIMEVLRRNPVSYVRISDRLKIDYDVLSVAAVVIVDDS